MPDSPESEARLRHAYQQLAAHVENTPLVVIEWDHGTRVSRWNAQAERVFGWAAAEVVGKGLFDFRFVHEDYAAMAEQMRAEGRAGRMPRNVVTTPNYTKAGGIVWCEWHNSVLYDTAGNMVSALSLALNVTERKRAEEHREALNRQLRDAHKWESLGVLAGGVAHDFNNILTVVLGSANLARRGVPANSAADAYLDQIEQSCRRAAEVCRQMLACAGRDDGGHTPLDLAQLVREAAPVLGEHPVRYELAADLPPIMGDAGQVRQVLMNLVTNAAEVLAGAPGDIVVRATEAEVRDGAADGAFHLAPPPGRYVCLAVSDPGPGMTADVRARMFDPFYSTKFTGRGLGLAAALGIVRAHRGGVRVESAPGQGTAVTVYWPAAEPLAPAAAAPTTANAALVIDGEMFGREVTASTLEEMGFAPLLAADAASGVALFGRHRSEIKLAVIDATAGDEVLRALRVLAPELPAVCVSGFAPRHERPADGRTEFLPKPFQPEALMAAVRRLTSSAPRP